MVSGVDLNRPEGVPHTGLFTSDQGAVRIGDLELFRVSDASIRMGNGIGVFRETGRRHGITYAGNCTVTGTINRAFINMGEARLALGYTLEDGRRLFHSGSGGTLSFTELADLLASTGNHGRRFPGGDYLSKNFYPPVVDVELMINKDQLPTHPSLADAPYEVSAVEGYMQKVIARRCMFNDYSITMNAQGTILSGPLTFMGSYVVWRREIA